MKDDERHVPIRTCISCGKKQSKKELIRLILDVHGRVVRDDDAKEKGRGAYVCHNKSCWEGLKKGKNLRRAFRGKDPSGLHPDLRVV